MNEAMDLWNKKGRTLITCPKGIAPWLAKELEGLRFPLTGQGEAAVETEGTLTDAMRLNLHLRTAHRILYRLASFPSRTAEDLYRGVKGIAWEEIVPWEGPQAYLSVTSTAETPSIRDSRFVNVKAKDAIVDRLTERCGRRPDSGPRRDRTVVHLFWKGEQVIVYLDTSGDPLSRRGYRKIPLEAPLQETLAAALIMATAWDGVASFVNPMCGSGTLAIEAALMALGMAPGLRRTNFGFMHLRGFSPDRWQRMRQEAAAAERGDGPRIVATDIDPRAVAAARQNAKLAGVEKAISFAACPFEETPVPEPPGVVILNPPYGERIGDADELAFLYRQCGDFFKQRCQGYRGYIFTANSSLGKEVGLRTKQRHRFFNGELECRLLEYELYAGSRKRKTNE